MRLIDVDRYQKELLSVYDDVSMGLEVLDRQPLVSAIPIPEGATNGEVIMTMFPNEEVVETDSACFYFGAKMRIDRDLWNAPYKKGTE